MTTAVSAPPESNANRGRLFFLDASGGRVVSVNPDGSDITVLVTGLSGRTPDGIVVDVEAGHIYWTEMGIPNANDGSIERADLDGANHINIVPPGGTHTPKQLQLDKKNVRLYWSDREGMRIMRSNLDGSDVETLIQTGAGPEQARDATLWCVGIALDVERQQLYWTQKGPDNGGLGRIFRANLEIPKGESPETRTDIQLLFDGLPEPIDLDIDFEHRLLYWTDRGDAPKGNTVNRAPITEEQTDREPEIVFTHLMEGIGVSLDVLGNRMFMTDLGGDVYSAALDGASKKIILAGQGNLTGIAYAELPLERPR